MFVFSSAENKLKSFVCEGSQFSLSCPNGDVMQVVNVLYGRNDAERCSINSEILVTYQVFHDMDQIYIFSINKYLFERRKRQSAMQINLSRKRLITARNELGVRLYFHRRL